MSQSPQSTGDGHGPWWESDISTVSKSHDAASADGPTAPEATVVDLTSRRRPEPAPPAPLVAPSGGVTARGTFLLVLTGAAIGCLIGFVLSGVTVVPATAGYGLIAGSVLGALICSPRLGWFPVAFPPLALFTVAVAFGQVTLLGTGFSVTRELAMLLSTLTAQAPAQLVSVVAVALILAIRRRLRR